MSGPYSALVIAEYDASQILPQTYQLVDAAQRIVGANGKIDILMAGFGCTTLAQSLTSCSGVIDILCMDTPVGEYQLAENLAPAIAELALGYTHLLAATTTHGKNLLPRVAGLLDVQPITDVIDIVDAHTFKRPIYAGSAIATLVTQEVFVLLTLRANSFQPVNSLGGSASLVRLQAPKGADTSSYVTARHTQSSCPELTQAKVIVAGGRGMQSREKFDLLFQLAGKLGAAVGASRAVVDAGFVDNELQVGQTGKIVAPELYIAIGLSGAVQHLAGIKDAKVIVAINSDPDAPIMQIADYALEGDLFEIVPQLLLELG